MSFIAPKLNCQIHQKAQITLLNLTQGHPDDKRLLCHRCNLQQQSNLFCLEDIFDFTNSLQNSEKDFIMMIQQDKDLLDLIKSQITQIHEQCNKLEIEYQQLLDLVNQNKIIKQNDYIDVCLQKQKLSSQQELIKMANQVSQLIKQNSQKLELVENNSIKYKNQNDELRKKIQDLQQSLEVASQLTGNSSEQITQIQQPKQNHFSQVSQPSIVQGYQFIKIAETYLEQAKIYDLKFNRENNLFVIGSSKINNDCYAQIWKYEKGVVQKIQDLDKGHQNDVKSICFSNQDDSFFTGSQDNTVIYWKMEPTEWSKGQVLEGQSSGVTGLQLNNSGNVLAAVSSQIHLWKKQNQKWEKAQVLNQCKKQFLCVTFNKDDSLLAAGSSDCQIYVYQFEKESWKLKNTIYDQSQEVTFITFLNGYNLMALLKDNNLNQYEYSSNNDYEQNFIKTLSAYQVGYSNRRQSMIVSSGRTNETQIYQLENQNQVNKMQSIPAKSDSVYSSNDGKILVVLANQKLSFYFEIANNN